MATALRRSTNDTTATAEPHRLEEALGRLPVTPTAKSGGGGYHYRFLIPPNLKLVSGGSLESVLNPDAEFKTFGGHEVLPPDVARFREALQVGTGSDSS